MCACACARARVCACVRVRACACLCLLFTSCPLSSLPSLAGYVCECTHVCGDCFVGAADGSRRLRDTRGERFVLVLGATAVKTGGRRRRGWQERAIGMA